LFWGLAVERGASCKERSKGGGAREEEQSQTLRDLSITNKQRIKVSPTKIHIK
jgi:hypothetical protein